MSDGSETNNPAHVTGTEHKEHEAHEAHIRILKGQPTDEELAALVAVLGSAGGPASEAGPPERNHWGLAVDKLRYAISNYQRVTLQQRTHLRR